VEPKTPDVHNFEIFNSGKVVADYAGADALQACEVALFETYIRPGMRVLDLGVGTGRTTPWLAAQADEYVGLDYSPRMIGVFRQLFPDLEARVGDAADLSQFDDGRFDAVVFSFNGIDYLHPAAKRDTCLTEIARVLSPRGVLIFSSHNARAFLRLPPVAPEAQATIHRRLMVAAYASVRLMARALPTSAFWWGEGYRRDIARSLVTYVVTPARVRRSTRRLGLEPEKTIAAEHPARGWWFSTPWYYYVFVKP